MPVGDGSQSDWFHWNFVKKKVCLHSNSNLNSKQNKALRRSFHYSLGRWLGFQTFQSSPLEFSIWIMSSGYISFCFLNEKFFIKICHKPMFVQSNIYREKWLPLNWTSNLYSSSFTFAFHNKTEAASVFECVSFS